MSLSIDLPKILEDRLIAYCAAQGISQGEAIKRAIDSLLSDGSPTPYELGATGFGADKTHGGDIARNSKRLLREQFRAPIDR